MVLIGSFTKDQVLVLVAATGWLALRERSRRMALVLVTGALASLPARSSQYTLTDKGISALGTPM